MSGPQTSLKSYTRSNNWDKNYRTAQCYFFNFQNKVNDLEFKITLPKRQGESLLYICG